jgi:pimeloyl-ACP methyl ester carboxylesterase
MTAPLTPIIFLHGWGACAQTFAPIAEFFKTARECIYIDFDCNPDTPKTLDDYVAQVENVITERKINSADIVGHSFGARVAVLLANRNPHIIRRMVLTGAAGLKPRFNVKTYLKIRAYKIFKIGSGSADYKKLSHGGKITFQNVIKRNLAPDIARVSQPTLLIFGKKDKSTPIYMSKRWTKLQKTSILKIYPRAGHFAFIDAPADFIRDAYNFFEGGSAKC